MHSLDSPRIRNAQSFQLIFLQCLAIMISVDGSATPPPHQTCTLCILTLVIIILQDHLTQYLLGCSSRSSLSSSSSSFSCRTRSPSMNSEQQAEASPSPHRLVHALIYPLNKLNSTPPHRPSSYRPVTDRSATFILVHKVFISIYVVSNLHIGT